MEAEAVLAVSRGFCAAGYAIVCRQHTALSGYIDILEWGLSRALGRVKVVSRRTQKQVAEKISSSCELSSIIDLVNTSNIMH